MTGKKVLAIDVDETLLNLEPLFFLKRFRKNYKESEGRTITFPDAKREYYMAPRPRLKEFLTEAKKHFQLAAFSVVSKDITREKLKLLGLDNEFAKIYGQEDLSNKKKDLQKVAEDFNVPLAHVIAIDDKPAAFTEDSKVIKVKPWLIGSNVEYEYQNNEDNLLGAFAKTLYA
jgi:phosphoglycolate phosphatase-like HAD superfamily hydrolase